MTWHEQMMVAKQDAKEASTLLTTHGFRLTESIVSEGNNSRYDGWHLTYASESVTLSFRYYEWELRIPIKYRGIESSYYLLDKKLASNASGFQGTMFPPNKLPDVMRRIVADLSHNYKDVLLGDPETWKRIEVMESENRRYIENRTQELSKKYQYGNTIQLAMEAFRKKEYVRVCEVLDPIEVHLEPLQRQKLAYARKKKDK